MSNTIQLQSVGHVPAIPASEMKIGDVRMYNFGSITVIVKIYDRTEKTLSVVEYDKSNNTFYLSDIRKTTLVAIVNRGQDVSTLNPEIVTDARRHPFNNDLKLADFENKIGYKNQIVEVVQVETTVEVEAVEVAAIETEVIETVQNEQKQETDNNVTYTLNEQMKGIEITFTEKPSTEVIEQLKVNGYRWSKRGFWYAKQSPERLEFAERLTGSNKTEQVETEQFSYPDIEINDIESYTVDEKLQRSEHESNWIFRTKEADRTKEIQSILQGYQNQVVSIIEQTDNERIIYNLKKELQRFKKAYHKNFVARLRNRSDSPSWLVTGRSGRNARRDQKYNDRYDNLMRESIQLQKEIENAIWKANSAIKRDKESKLRQQIEQTNIDIEFKTESKEITFNGLTEKIRAYLYGDYMICKTWGCFRIFQNGKNIHSMKTTDKLDDAKRYVSMLVQKESVAV